jgi:hypothetical protein
MITNRSGTAVPWTVSRHMARQFSVRPTSDAIPIEMKLIGRFEHRDGKSDLAVSDRPVRAEVGEV